MESIKLGELRVGINHTLIGYDNNKYNVFFCNMYNNNVMKFEIYNFIGKPIYISNNLPGILIEHIIIDENGYLCAINRNQDTEEVSCYKYYIANIIPMFKNIVHIKHDIYITGMFLFMIYNEQEESKFKIITVSIDVFARENCINVLNDEHKRYITNEELHKAIYGSFNNFEFILRNHYFYIDIKLNSYVHMICDKFKNNIQIINGQHNGLRECEYGDLRYMDGDFAFEKKCIMIFASKKNINMFIIKPTEIIHKNIESDVQIMPTNYTEKKILFKSDYDFLQYKKNIETFILCIKHKPNNNPKIQTRHLKIPKYILLEILYYSSIQLQQHYLLKKID